MGFHAEKYDIERAGIFKAGNYFRIYEKVFVTADDPHTMLLHGVQMRAAGVQRDVVVRARQKSADVCAHCSGANDQKFHAFSPPEKAAATARRWILPVAVRGMVSTMCIFLGHLKSARCSRQKARSAASSFGSRSTTATATSSPQAGCGMPKATASATQGCFIRTSSISSGAIFSPPRTINSLIRAVRWR